MQKRMVSLWTFSAMKLASAVEHPVPMAEAIKTGAHRLDPVSSLRSGQLLKGCT